MGKLFITTRFNRYVSTCLWLPASVMASTPILSITPLYRAPTQLAANGFTAAMYQVTNNTKTLTQFAMQSMAGVTQVTSIPGACQNPIVLNYGQSCQLDLRIVGSQIKGRLSGGPVICNLAAQPMSCSQPAAANLLNVSIKANNVQNTWISALIAQDPPPDDLATYMNKIITLAPSLTQLHLRVTPGATNLQQYADLIHLFHTAYATPLTMAYHPDNSTTSYAGWGCALPPDPAPPAPSSYSSCVLSASIQNMNAMNALADPQQTGQGFTLFSLEQGDVEIVPSSNANFQSVKACLNPAQAASGVSCPAPAVIASPTVSFGDVTQSYGVGYYGPTMLDYTYPQFYNLAKHVAPYADLITNGFFPSETTSCLPYTTSLYAVDVDNSDTPYSPQIPCLGAGQTYANTYTYPDPTTHGVSPVIVASYMSYLMTQYPPIAVTIPLSGSTAFITYSGEDFVFGAPGWALALWAEFYQTLYTDFGTLKRLHPELFPQSGTDPATLKYAVWNFSSMLDEIEV